MPASGTSATLERLEIISAYGSNADPIQTSLLGLQMTHSGSRAYNFADAFRQGMRSLGYVEGQNDGLPVETNATSSRLSACVEAGKGRAAGAPNPKGISFIVPTAP